MKVHKHTKGCFRSHQDSLPELTHRLRKGGAHRMTGPREAVLDAMRAADRPLAIKEIHELLKGTECDLATVYRSMHLLCKSGMVRRVEFGKGGRRFELIPERQEGHHHHLICTECEKVVLLDDCLLDQVAGRIASATGFKEITHQLEFFGRCPACQ
ncbi:MAG: transcriptional repressor [Verrucomicrobia bacterium]|nr:transcriptional repressor [Verrucomicrobiota bacterium]